MSKKVYPKLFKYTTKKQVQEWQIIAEDDKFYTIEGIQNGKLTTSLPTICKPKNVGRSNETTAEQQALNEAQAKWQKKVDSGYNEILTTKKNFVEPMLAFEYDKYPINWEQEIVYTQPKLDGLRAINENNTLMSRNGKPYVSAPHLYQDKVTLDGELYNHKFKDDFNKVVSLFKKQKPSDEELKECEKYGQYWVYDMPNIPGGYDKRCEAMLKWYANLPDEDKKKFKIVPSKVVTSKQQLDEVHARNLELGYEGTIIRRLNIDYEFKRSKQLLKFKDFIDEEFEITGAEEGTGGRTGTIGFFHMKMKDGKTFKSNVKGDFDYLKDIWKNHKSYIGTEATVKYFNLTPAGIPRFPYIIKLDRESIEG